VLLSFLHLTQGALLHIDCWQEGLRLQGEQMHEARRREDLSMGDAKILVIGGAGYVGSHFALFAYNHGYDVTVMDNLSKGHRAAIRAHRFVHLDLLDKAGFEAHLSAHRYDGIFHFAASCLVGESVEKPSLYYKNNVIAAFTMLEAMRATGHNRLVFSSTCAVYGVPERLPISEDHPKNPISPYGRSKLAIEWMLEDYQRAYGIRSAALRYFNAAGCEPAYDLGEDHDPETHLIPNVARYALGLQRELTIFGDDYPTPDGTCIRDYIHVTDLAHAHLKALQMLEKEPLLQVNLGAGTGLSNRQVVDAVAKVSGRAIHPKIGPRRPGDPPELVADPRVARDMLDWTPQRSDIESIAAEVLQWLSKHPKGYEG
jgi:UDP-glucose 4-epimerase